MANNQYTGLNDPTWGYKAPHLGAEMNQGGKDRGTGTDQAMSKSMPELMNQGGSTEHPSAHPIGHKKKGPALGKMMGQ